MRIAHLLREVIKLPDEEFVSRLYEEILARPPDPLGWRHHAQLLSSGMSRWEVVVLILRGEEAETTCFGLRPPPRSYTQTKEWIESQHAGLSGQELVYQPYTSPDERSIRAEPKGMEQNVHWKFAGHSLVPPLPQFVAAISGGRVLGRAGDIISPDNKLVADLSIDYISGSPRHRALFSLPVIPPARYLPETVAVIANGAADNYYHWMMEVTARFHLLRQSQIRIDKYVINRLRLPFQTETLDALGIPPHQRIELDENTHLEAKTLIVPSFGGYTGKPPQWASDFVAKELMVNRGIGPAAGFERIYVSRAGASYRKVVNEPGLSQLLQKYGFRTVQLERLSVARQASIFNGAKVIIAPHGAGLTNIMFCRPGTIVIELFSPHYVNWLYWIMSDNHGLDYYYLIGEGSRPQALATVDDLGAHIFVNLYVLKTLLDKVIGGA